MGQALTGEMIQASLLTNFTDYRKMGQLDSQAQIAFLFVGATFVSFVLIALLNAEAKSRLKDPELEIQNGNIFSTLLQKVTRLVSSVVDSNNTLDHYSYRDSMHRFKGRSLKWIPIVANEVLSYQTKMAQINKRNESRHKSNETLLSVLHHIRHHGKHHKETIIQSNDILKAVNHPASTVALNGTTKWRQHDIIEHSLNVSATLDVEKTPICYTTNEVLIIIGLTCILNFAFIVLIMSCVHFCSNTTTRKIADLPRLDSLVMIESGDTSDTYCEDIDTKEDELAQTSLRNSRQTVEDYIKSLPTQLYLSSTARSRSESMLSLHSLTPVNSARRNYQQLVSSLDDLVSETAIRAQRQNSAKYSSLVNTNQALSVSAENLLFV